MSNKFADMKLLAAEFEGKTRDKFDDDAILELYDNFKAIVGMPAKPTLDNMDNLPSWFLAEALEFMWQEVKEKEKFIYYINLKLEEPKHRELKIQIAAAVSINDPQSGIQILEKMDNKQLRKKGELPKNYIDSLLKYFARDGSRPLLAILESNIENQRASKSASIQFFEALFSGKSTTSLINKHALQSKLLTWLITNKQFTECTKLFPDYDVTKEILAWPLSMLPEYESIQKTADSAGIMFNITNFSAHNLFVKYDQDVQKNELIQAAHDTELLDEICKRLSRRKESVDTMKEKINDKSATIQDLQRQKEQSSQKIDSLEEEKMKMIVQNAATERKFRTEVHLLEEDNQKHKKIIEEKENTIAELYREIGSIKHDSKAQIDEATKRIEIESKHAQKQFAEKIHDQLLQEFTYMKILDDSERHSTAKILLGHIFDKLNGLGIVFN